MTDPTPPIGQPQLEDETAVAEKPARAVVCWFHDVDDCTRPVAQMWQRFATNEELERWKADEGIASVTAGDAQAFVPVFACAVHVPKIMDDEGDLVPNLDLFVFTHQAHCPLPGSLCICQPPEVEHVGSEPGAGEQAADTRGS